MPLGLLKVAKVPKPFKNGAPHGCPAMVNTKVVAKLICRIAQLPVSATYKTVGKAPAEGDKRANPSGVEN
jgi:hypothetical protein